MNVTLLVSMEEPTLADMKVGQSAYTVPWAMYADSERRLWLNPHISFESGRAGTARMRVTRLPEGFRVHHVPGEAYAPGGTHSCADEDGLPVIELTGVDDENDAAS